MSREFHPLVKEFLDGERSAADLPAELRAEAEAAQQLLAAVDRRLVTLPPSLEVRVMAAVRARANSPHARAWRWVTAPSVPPWMAGALAAAAALALLLLRPTKQEVVTAPPPAAPESIYVKFVLYAPEAKLVTLAGTFNRWDPGATPLVRGGSGGVWTVTLALPVGQHQYSFVLDGQQWMADPAAPAVSDGFGRQNSIVSVSATEARAL